MKNDSEGSKRTFLLQYGSLIFALITVIGIIGAAVLGYVPSESYQSRG